MMPLPAQRVHLLTAREGHSVCRAVMAARSLAHDRGRVAAAPGLRRTRRFRLTHGTMDAYASVGSYRLTEGPCLVDAKVRASVSGAATRTRA
jgi:hypothetical protein